MLAGPRVALKTVFVLAVLTTGLLATLAASSWEPWPAARASKLVVMAAGCDFQAGFRALRDQIPTLVGDCLGNERFNPRTGESLQPTIGGLMVWRQVDNWTAFTNGTTTWINGPYGLQSRPNGERFAWEPSPNGERS